MLSCDVSKLCSSLAVHIGVCLVPRHYQGLCRTLRRGHWPCPRSRFCHTSVRASQTCLAWYHYNTPSLSPGSLFTRFCSQSSRSFAASRCETRAASAHASMSSHRTGYTATTHVVFVPDVDLTSLSTDTELFLPGHLPHFSVVFLVSDSCCGGEHERAGDDDRDKGQPEEEKWAFREGCPVARRNGVCLGGRDVFLPREHAHCDRLVIVTEPGPNVVRQSSVAVVSQGSSWAGEYATKRCKCWTVGWHGTSRLHRQVCQFSAESNSSKPDPG
jgi:hypothetical protein